MDDITYIAAMISSELEGIADYIESDFPFLSTSLKRLSTALRFCLRKVGRHMIGKKMLYPIKFDKKWSDILGGY